MNICLENMQNNEDNTMYDGMPAEKRLALRIQLPLAKIKENNNSTPLSSKQNRANHCEFG